MTPNSRCCCIGPRGGFLFALALAVTACLTAFGTPPAKQAAGETPLARTRRLVAEKKPVRIVAFGDSISEVKPRWNGGAKSPEANWAAVLVKRLGEAHPESAFTLRNFGVGGENTAEGLARLDGLADHAPDLAGRVSVSGVFRPGDPGSYTDMMTQAFVRTDVIASGLLAFGQHIELQWQVP